MAYCHIAAGLHFAWALLCIWAARQGPEWVQAAQSQDIPVPDGFFTLAGLMLGTSAIVFGGVSLWLPTVKKSKEAWAMHFTNIVLGVCSLVLTPFLLPLLINWTRPEVKEWFIAE